MSGVINSNLVSELMQYLEPAAQTLIRQIMRGEVDVNPEAGINPQTKIEGLNDAQVRAVRNLVTATVGRDVDPNGLSNILATRNYGLSQDSPQSTPELRSLVDEIRMADRNNRLAGPDVPASNTLETIANEQPGWLRELMLNNIDENPLIQLDPKLQGLIQQVRDNPEDFSAQVVTDIVQNFVTGSARSETQANESSLAVEQRARELLQQDDTANQIGTSALRAGMQGSFANLRAEEIEEDFASMVNGQNLINPDDLRRMWDDAVFENRADAVAQFQETAKELDTFLNSPQGKAYYSENPDELPINYTFDSSEDKLFPTLDFGDTPLNYREAVELLNNPGVSGKHIRRVNELLTAAGYYTNTIPLNMEDPNDQALTDAWKELLAHSFLSNQKPLAVINDRIDEERQKIEQIVSQFDDTMLASNVDSLAWSVLGRRLSASEYEQIKTQISAFGDIEPLLGNAGGVATEVQRLETEFLPADSIKLQRALQRTFEPEFSQRQQFVNSRASMEELRSLIRGRAEPIDTLPDVVLNQGENAQ